MYIYIYELLKAETIAEYILDVLIISDFEMEKK